MKMEVEERIRQNQKKTALLLEGIMSLLIAGTALVLIAGSLFIGDHPVIPEGVMVSVGAGAILSFIGGISTLMVMFLESAEQKSREDLRRGDRKRRGLLIAGAATLWTGSACLAGLMILLIVESFIG